MVYLSTTTYVTFVGIVGTVVKTKQVFGILDEKLLFNPDQGITSELCNLADEV